MHIRKQGGGGKKGAKGANKKSAPAPQPEPEPAAANDDDGESAKEEDGESRMAHSQKSSAEELGRRARLKFRRIGAAEHGLCASGGAAAPADTPEIIASKITVWPPPTSAHGQHP